MKVLNSIFLVLAALFFVSCVSGTFTQKTFVKRDRFGESPVVDMRDMVSLNEKIFEKKK
jgi:hypothetical protein